MRTLDQHLDQAKAVQGLPSDRQLDLALGAKGCNTFTYRKGRALPTDETMIKIARLSGMDPRAALIDLATWRSSEMARPIWRQIADVLPAAS